MGGKQKSIELSMVLWEISTAPVNCGLSQEIMNNTTKNDIEYFFVNEYLTMSAFIDYTIMSQHSGSRKISLKAGELEQNIHFSRDIQSTKMAAYAVSVKICRTL